ncbi:hypothetical protein [Spiroplasma culicicola]|uniref:Uncharacterized protein n=1 Tax=Spiroplasma culicicola AES-1 TaxID=1276246 RepID=W6A7P8_9MOLU|nr:hypothetical protein [Spiroplasma culicicola]AHI52890.1 hypothetical protein SCULI_v1c05490 [Spiroplasma culicicola AES-1]
MELYTKININKIIFDLYKKDSLALIASPDFQISDTTKQELITMASTESLKTLFEGLNNIFEKNLGDDQFDLSLMLTLFLQRYNYFYHTELEWKKYCKNVKEVDFKDPGTFFLDYIAFFFEGQIEKYNSNYYNILHDFHVEEWNPKFFSDLKNLLDNVEQTKDFQRKLMATEELVKFLQDTKNIYASLEAVGVEQEKKEFLAHSNEIKIVYQSMNHLINEILIKVLKF